MAAIQIYASFPSCAAPVGNPLSPLTSHSKGPSPRSSIGPPDATSPSMPGMAHRRSDSRIFGAVPTGIAGSSGISRGGSDGGAEGSAGSAKLPRPLARLLKPVQNAGDSSFDNINRVTVVGSGGDSGGEGPDNEVL